MTAYRENLKAGVFDQLAAENAEERGEDLDPSIVARIDAREDDEDTPEEPQGYAAMKVEDLRPLAAEREIEGRSGLDKDGLVAALEAYDAEHEGDD